MSITARDMLADESNNVLTVWGRVSPARNRRLPAGSSKVRGRSTRDGSETSFLGLGGRILIYIYIYIPRGGASEEFWIS